MNRLKIVLLILVLLACSNSTEGGPVNLRIFNKTGMEISEVIVNSVTYSAIEIDGYSNFKKHDYIYRYAYIKAIIGGKDYVLQPIDYVGESKLTSGDYTFKLEIVNNELQQSIE